jgi:hypothetical protein
MHTILKVDHEARLLALFLNNFVDACRTVSLGWFGVFRP